MKKIYVLTLCFSISLILAQQPGDLDVSFGTNGKVVSNISNAAFNVKSQVVQTDGKILLAGQINDGSNSKGFIFRLNTDGSLDTSFNTTGRVVHPFLEGFEVVKLQPDGKIVAGSSYNNDAAIARYNSNGTLDSGFALSGTFYNSDTNNPPSDQRIVYDLEIQADGKILGLTTLFLAANERDYIVFRLLANGIQDANFIIQDGFGEFVFPKSLNLQTDGKIIVSGNYNATNDIVFFSRYNSDGSVDTTFNSTGKQSVSISGATTTKINDVIIQPDGKIVASGKYFGSTSVLFLIRINSNGTFDATFSGDGLAGVNINTEFNDNFNGKLVIQPDAKIILMDVEYNNTTNSKDIILVRFTPAGSIDTTFNSIGGVFMSFFNNNDVGAGISIFNDKIIVSGNTEEYFYKDKIAIARLNVSNGSYDTTFDLDGKYTFDSFLEGYEEVSSSLILANGKILTLGNVFANNNYYPSLVRYNSDGSLDTTFGENGRLVYDLFTGSFNDFVLDNNGKILIAGNVFGFGSGLLLIKVDANGQLDTTFGVNGLSDLSISGSFGGTINTIKILPDNKIIVAGHIQFNNNETDLLLMKLNENGTFDSSFGINGISYEGSSSTPLISDSINSIEILNDNKIIAIAYVENSLGNFEAQILKYNTIGLLDPTFNSNGRVITNKMVEDFSKSDIAIQSDGKILATFEAISGNNVFLLYRLNSNGTFDNTFDFDGLVETYINGDDYSSNIYYNPLNGKIVLAGNTIDSNVNFALVRYTSDGNLDNSFGNFGTIITDFNSTDDVLIKSNITSDGKLVVAGYVYNQTTENLDHALAKYHLEAVLSETTFNNNQEKITFYPNPTIDYLNIDFNDITLYNRDYLILDINGKTIFKNIIDEDNKIDVRSLNKGIYFIIIADQKAIKFIKE